MSRGMRGAVVVKLVLGGFLAFVGVSCSAISVGMMVSPGKPDDPQSGMAILILSIGIFGIPAAILLWLGLRGRRYDRQLQQVIAMGMASARLPLQQLAAQLGVPVPKAQELVLDAISRGKLFGRLDYEHGTFISAAAHQGVQQLSMRCGACGATSQVIVSPGTASNCRFCGHRLA